MLTVIGKDRLFSNWYAWTQPDTLRTRIFTFGWYHGGTPSNKELYASSTYIMTVVSGAVVDHWCVSDARHASPCFCVRQSWCCAEWHTQLYYGDLTATEWCDECSWKGQRSSRTEHELLACSSFMQHSNHPVRCVDGLWGEGDSSSCWMHFDSFFYLVLCAQDRAALLRKWNSCRCCTVFFLKQCTVAL